MKISGDVPKIPGIYNKNKMVANVDKSAPVASKRDAVSISGSGKDFQAVLKAVQDKPDIRQERVDEISQKIEAGTYNVDAKEVAEKIVDSIINKKV